MISAVPGIWSVVISSLIVLLLGSAMPPGLDTLLAQAFPLNGAFSYVWPVSVTCCFARLCLLIRFLRLLAA